MSASKPAPLPSSLLPKRLQDGAYAPWVCTYDAFGVLVPCEGVASFNPAPEGSFVFPIRDDLGQPLSLDEYANVCGVGRFCDPTVGVWINEDASFTAPPLPPG